MLIDRNSLELSVKIIENPLFSIRRSLVFQVKIDEHCHPMANSIDGTSMNVEGCSTETVTITAAPARPHSPTLVLELHRPTETGPRVRWSEETVDNEFLNRKKSKCCCVFTKDHDADAQDDKDTTVDEFDNCQHCRFHTQSDYAAKPEDRRPKIKLVVGKPNVS